jgi:hypothetical protein
VKTFAGIEADIDACSGDAADGARLLALSEQVLEQWIIARGDTPTHETREGFRLLALHRQGARDLPSFNACRETCREIAYHYNLIENSGDSALNAALNVQNAVGKTGGVLLRFTPVASRRSYTVKAKVK